MKKNLLFTTLLLCAITLLRPYIAAACDDEQLPSTYIQFIENKGQWDSQIQYQIEMRNARLFMENDRLTYALMNGEDLDLLHEAHHNSAIDINDFALRCHAFQVRFEGCNAVSPISSCLHDTYRNYYIGKNPEHWASKVGLYAQIDYPNLYNGIDMRFYGDGGSIKYDFIVQPNADIAQIQLRYDGTDDLYVQNGSLYAVTTVNTIIENRPYAYQYINGQLREVSCNFVVQNNVLSFNLPEGYDPTAELIIDPTLIFSTYSGSTADNWGFTATYDQEGHLFSGGAAFGIGYPTTLGAYQVNFAGGAGGLFTDISLSKFNPAGSQMLYSTYIGGSLANEMPHSLVVNENDELILYGTTGSADYPTTTNAFNSNFSGGINATINAIAFPQGSDIVISKLNADGSVMLASTYIGGVGNDGLNTASALKYNYADEARGEIFFDNQNNIYVASSTNSPDFPATFESFQPFSNGQQEGCVLKFSPDLSQLIWGTYLGGSGNDAVYSVKPGADGSIYVSGGTTSSDFPTTSGTIQPTYSGGTADAFVAQLSENGDVLLASTFVGTSSYDQAYMVDLDANGNVYIVGQSTGNHPVIGDVYSNANGKVFLRQLSADLSTTQWATVIGSGGSTPNISPTAFLVDQCGQIFISGWGGALNGNLTTTGLTVTPGAFQSTTDGNDFYFMTLGENATSLIYATYFGSATGTSEHVDGGTSRFDKKGVIYQAVCAGCGNNDSFPTTPGAWSNTNNSSNCNVGSIKFDFELAPVIADFNAPTQFCDGQATINFDNNSINAESYSWNFGDNSTSTDAAPSHTFNQAGTYTVSLTATKAGTCNGFDTKQLTIVVADNPTVTIISSPVCVNDGTDAVSLGFLIVGGDTAGYAVSGSYNGEVGNNVPIFTTVSASATPFSISILGLTTDCAADFSLELPNCPDCDPSPGTMPTALQTGCYTDVVTATTVGESLTTGQHLFYAVATNSNDIAGSIVALNTTGTFGFNDIANAMYYQTYYIVAIVAFAENGFPLLDDGCTRISNTSPILFIAPVSYEIDESCDFITGVYSITLAPTGGYPQYDNISTYSIVGDYQGELAYGESFSHSFEEGETDQYSFIITDMGGCGSLGVGKSFYCEKTPLTLISFLGDAQPQGNLLQWTTASEDNTSYFELQYATDGNNFRTLTTVPAAGNSTSNLSYTYFDKTATCGTRYYRLIGVDIDRTQTIYGIIAVERGGGTTPTVFTANVWASTQQLEVNAPTTGNTQLRIYATTGALVYTQKYDALQCNTPILVDVARLSTGLYCLQIQTGGEIYNTKFVK